MNKGLFVLALLAPLAGACSKLTAPPSNDPPRDAHTVRPTVAAERAPAKLDVTDLTVGSGVEAKSGDKVKLVRFGDPEMSIKKDQPARKKSYCARSGGIEGGDGKLSANYWSRKAWNC